MLSKQFSTAILLSYSLLVHSNIHSTTIEQSDVQNKDTQECFAKSDCEHISIAPEYQEKTFSVLYARNIRIKAVLLNLRSIDKTKALQYACALAMTLQKSNNPYDQELYTILCKYIALAFYEKENQIAITMEEDAQEPESPISEQTTTDNHIEHEAPVE